VCSRRIAAGTDAAYPYPNDSGASRFWFASNLLQSKGNALGQTSKITQGFDKTIIAYLRTLTPIANDVPDHQLDFPLSIRVRH